MFLKLKLIFLVAKQILLRLGLKSILREQMKLWEKGPQSKKSLRTCDVPSQKCQSQPTDRMFDVSFKSSHEIGTPSSTVNSDKSNINNDDNSCEGNVEVPIRNLITGIQKSEYFAREWTHKKIETKEPTFKNECCSISSTIASPNKNILTTLKNFGETNKCSTLTDLETHDIVEAENNPITLSNALKSDKSNQTNSKISARLNRFAYKGKDASKQLMKRPDDSDSCPSKINQSEETDNTFVPNEVSYYANVHLSHFSHWNGMLVSTGHYEYRSFS